MYNNYNHLSTPIKNTEEKKANIRSTLSSLAPHFSPNSIRMIPSDSEEHWGSPLASPINSENGHEFKSSSIPNASSNQYQEQRKHQQQIEEIEGSLLNLGLYDTSAPPSLDSRSREDKPFSSSELFRLAETDQEHNGTLKSLSRDSIFGEYGSRQPNPNNRINGAQNVPPTSLINRMLPVDNLSCDQTRISPTTIALPFSAGSGASGQDAGYGAHGSGAAYNGSGAGYNGNGAGYNGNGAGYNGNGAGYNGNGAGYNGNGAGYNGNAGPGSGYGSGAYDYGGRNEYSMNTNMNPNRNINNYNPSLSTMPRGMNSNGLSGLGQQLLPHQPAAYDYGGRNEYSMNTNMNPNMNNYNPSLSTMPRGMNSNGLNGLGHQLLPHQQMYDFSMSSTSYPPPPQISENELVYTVQFKRAHKTFFLSPVAKKVDVKIGDFVKVEADRGEDLGIICEINPISSQKRVLSKISAGGQSVIKKILRLATAQECLHLPVKQREEDNVLQVSIERAMNTYNLPMTVVDAEYQFDRHKLTIYYQSNERIDFRELVRDLFAIYKTRIWMEHITYSFRPNEAATIALQSGLNYHMLHGIQPTEEDFLLQAGFRAEPFVGRQQQLHNM